VQVIRGKKSANTKTETSIKSSLVTSKDKFPIKSLEESTKGCAVKKAIAANNKSSFGNDAKLQ